MNDQTKQAVSALVDGEVSRKEITALLGRLSASADMRSQWDHYHLISDVMRGETIHEQYRQVAGKVRQRLADESLLMVPTGHRPRNKRRGRDWVKPMAGAAIAASVAVVVVLKSPNVEFEQMPLAGTPQSPVAATPAIYAPSTGTRWNTINPEVESKLNRLLLTHQVYSPITRMKGILPVNFVRYDSGR